MSNETKKKAEAAFAVAPTTEQRIAIMTSLSQVSPCPRCGSGPVATAGDLRKIKLYNEIWDLFSLADLEGKTPDELAAMMTADKAAGATPPVEVVLKVDVVLFLFDALTKRAKLTSLGPIALHPMLEQIVVLAAMSSTRLATYEEQEKWVDADDDDVRELLVSPAERLSVRIAYVNPVACRNVLSSPDGTRDGYHGLPADGPSGYREIALYARAYDVLNLGEFSGKSGAELEAIAADKVDVAYSIDLAAARFLGDLLLRRIENVPNGPRRLVALLDKLEAVKGGAGKPAPEEPKVPENGAAEAPAEIPVASAEVPVPRPTEAGAAGNSQ